MTAKPRSKTTEQSQTPPPPSTSTSTSDTSTPVTVSLSDLTTGQIPLSTLTAAFGPSSLGIILISHLPSSFPLLRRRLLLYASRLASLPPSTLSDLTCPEAKYLVGWSHGRETLPPKSKPDLGKGSFYVNCAFYRDPALQAPPVVQGYEGCLEYLGGNVWPVEDGEDHGGMKGFRETMEEMCRLVIDVAGLVARNIDRFAEGEVDGYQSGYLEGVVRGSYTTKARLLHYFPMGENGDGGEDGEGGEDDAWCATHLDHGCLTGLLSAMYLPSGGSEEEIACPDPTAGLYIHSRDGKAVKVSIPPDTLAFQTGEALQKITAGKFKAVPHYVSPGKIGGPMRGIERNTLAVFTQPNLQDVVDLKTGEQFGRFARGVVDRNTVKG